MYAKLAKTVVIGTVILHFSLMAIACDISDISTDLARATYKIEGEGSIGTAFFVGIPNENDPSHCFPVLITASQVLNNMKGDKAVLYLRKRVGEFYKKVPFELTIRAEGKNLWVSHEYADVAVMRLPFFDLPEDIDRPTLFAFSTWLADDGYLKDVVLRPGDELLCLGYPLGQEVDDAGLSILRSGKISYPMLPTRETGRILLDLEVFKGDSGGPVYFYHKGSPRRNECVSGVYTYQFIVGLMKGVSSEEHQKENKLLKLAEVVPSVFIKEAIENLLSREKFSPIKFISTQDINKPTEEYLEMEKMYKTSDDEDFFKQINKNIGQSTSNHEGPLLVK